MGVYLTSFEFSGSKLDLQLVFDFISERIKSGDSNYEILIDSMLPSIVWDKDMQTVIPDYQELVSVYEGKVLEDYFEFSGCPESIHIDIDTIAEELVRINPNIYLKYEEWQSTTGVKIIHTSKNGEDRLKEDFIIPEDEPFEETEEDLENKDFKLEEINGKIYISKYIGDKPIVYIPDYVHGLYPIDMGVFDESDFIEGFTVSDKNEKFISEDGVLFNKEKTKLFRCPPKKQGAYKIPQSVEKIFICAFSACVELTEVEFFNGVTEIGDCAFSDCRSLKSITLPRSLTAIDPYVFAGCTSLASITIPDSVTVIEESAFRDCTSLASINLPENVIKIDPTAFAGCEETLTIHAPATSFAQKYAMERGISFSEL